MEFEDIILKSFTVPANKFVTYAAGTNRMLMGLGDADILVVIRHAQSSIFIVCDIYNKYNQFDSATDTTSIRTRVDVIEMTKEKALELYKNYGIVNNKTNFRWGRV